MELLKYTALFAVSIFALIKSADYFTVTAEKVGLHFKIPPFIIGVTIIALGTSLPEIATSIVSVLSGHSEIVIGNVTGSNIANILFILAITAIVGKHLYVDKDIIKIDLPILLGSTVLLFITCFDGEFKLADGVLTLACLITYLVYNVKSHRKVDSKELRDQKKLAKEEKKELPIKYPFIILGSGVALYFSAKYTVQSVVEIAAYFKIAEELVAISAIAIGTSLPELAVSVVAAKQGKADIAIGNITGSNIFNALGVMGIPALFGTLQISQEMITFTIPALIFVTILYIVTTMDKEISQWEGLTLLFLYIAFMGKIFGLV